MDNASDLKMSSLLFDRLEKLGINESFKMNVEGYFLTSQYLRLARVHVEYQLMF
jgi:hypothetical protein